jgi:hypothetical protein
MLRRRDRARDPGSDRDDELVEIATLGRVEAELVAARLRDEGFGAVAFGTGAAGAEPGLDWAEGTRVMVRRREVDRATALVAEWLGS